jgi:hypothetical protein
VGDKPGAGSAGGLEFPIGRHAAETANIHILLEEIVADVDEDNQEIVLLLHWAGGRHSELRVKKNELGKHRRCTSLKAIEIIRQMA